MESMVFRGAVAWLLMCSVAVSIRPVKWPAEVAGDAVREPWFYDLGKHATKRHARTVHLAVTQTQTLRYSASVLFCFTVKAKAFCIFTQKIQSSRSRDVEQVLISVA